MSAATGVVPRDKIQSPYRPLGGYVKSGASFKKGWAIARNASGLFVVPTEVDTLLPGGFADRTLADAAAGDDTDEVNAETGLYSVRMKSDDTFGATDKPAPIYFVNNDEFGKTKSTRSIAGCFLSLDHDRPTTHCLAWIGPEGVAMAQSLASVAALVNSGAVVVDEWTDPAAPSTTALKAATASQVAPLTVLVAAMSAPGIAALLAYPRNLTFTTAGATATNGPDTALITGTDINGAALTETVSGLRGGAATYQGVKAFKTVVSVVYGAALDVDATVAIGIGKKFGLSQKIKQRIALPHVIQELAVNAVVATGTYVSAATSPPNGTYAPSADPDAAKDYALTYEQDPS